MAFRQILCAIDYSPSSREALRYALDLARHANGRVSVLHVLEYMDPVQPSQPVGAAMRTCRQHLIDLARERLRSTLAAESRSCCEIEEVVALNAHRAYREILQRATAMAADLIVIGAQGAGGLELMLYGSNTHYVVRAASCPVLTLRAA